MTRAHARRVLAVVALFTALAFAFRTAQAAPVPGLSLSSRIVRTSVRRVRAKVVPRATWAPPYRYRLFISDTLRDERTAVADSFVFLLRHDSTGTITRNVRVVVAPSNRSDSLYRSLTVTIPGRP